MIPQVCGVRMARAHAQEEGEAQITNSAMPAMAKRIVPIRKKRRSLESSSRSLGLCAILKKKRRKPAIAKRMSQTGIPAISVGMERIEKKQREERSYRLEERGAKSESPRPRTASGKKKPPSNCEECGLEQVIEQTPWRNYGLDDSEVPLT